jgi:hypothetical protein
MTLPLKRSLSTQSNEKSVYEHDASTIKHKLIYQRQNTDLAKSNAYLQSQLKKEKLENHSLQKENLRLNARILESERQMNAMRGSGEGLRNALKERMPALRIIAKHLDEVAKVFMDIAQGEEGSTGGSQNSLIVLTEEEETQ